MRLQRQVFCASDSLQYCARKVLNAPLQTLLETGNESADSQAIRLELKSSQKHLHSHVAASFSDIKFNGALQPVKADFSQYYEQNEKSYFDSSDG